MSRLIEFLITGTLKQEEFEQNIVYPNNLDRLFLDNLFYIFKPKKNEDREFIWYEFQLTDEFGSPLYGSCYSKMLNNNEYQIIALLSAKPKSYTFRSILHEVHLCILKDFNIYPFLAELCRLIIPDTFELSLHLPLSLSNVILNNNNDCRSHYIMNYLNPALTAIILHDILVEKSILFISNSLSKLSHCAQSFQIIIEPLKYSGVIVPIVPYSLIQTVEAPTLYIMGCHSSCLGRSSINFKNSDLVVDLDTLEVITDQSTARNTLDLEQYTRKVSKVIGGYCLSSDENPNLLQPIEQEKQFRALWHHFIVNLCSCEEVNPFYTAFSKTSMFKMFDFKQPKTTLLKQHQLAVRIPLEEADITITQESFLQLLRMTSYVQQSISKLHDPVNMEMLFYEIICKHIWTHYDESNPILDIEDCTDTIKAIIALNVDEELKSAQIQEISNHLSEMDKKTIALWDLPKNLKEQMISFNKRRSTQVFRKSMSLKQPLAAMSILSKETEALFSSQQVLAQSHALILNESLITKESLKQPTEAELVAQSASLLDKMIAVYNSSTSLMYRADKKDAIARFIGDRKNISLLSKTSEYQTFIDALRLFGLYQLDYLVTDASKWCFWTNIRHLMFLHALIAIEQSEEHLKASDTIGYQLGNIVITLSDLVEGLCRPNGIVRFYTKSNNLWRGLSPELQPYAPSMYPQEINFILSDYSGSSCRIQPYVVENMNFLMLAEIDQIVEFEFKIDIKKKRIVMPLQWSWLYKEFGDHPNDMLIAIVELLPENAFTTILKNNEAIRYENGKAIRMSRKWSIKFFKESQFSCKFKV